MLRKIALASTFLIVATTFAQERTPAMSAGPPNAARIPKVFEGTIVNGVVSSVSGNIASLAGGLVTIDTSQAKIVQGDLFGHTRPIASITAGESVSAVYGSSNLGAECPLPAMFIVKWADMTIDGPVQSIGTNSLTVLGRTIAVDADTSFPAVYARGLSDFDVGKDVDITANRVNGTLVAAAVCLRCPRELPIPAKFLHGTVKGIGTSSWVITDRWGKDSAIIVNSETRITGDPKVADIVHAVVNTDSAIAFAIVKSAALLMAQRGTVKAISTTSLRIGPTTIDLAPDYVFPLTSQTRITGDPKLGDIVDVLVNNDLEIVVSITKSVAVPLPPLTLRGTVKDISGVRCMRESEPPCTWWISSAAGLGPDYMVQVTAQTKLIGDPKVGDTVVVVVVPDANGYVAASVQERMHAVSSGSSNTQVFRTEYPTLVSGVVTSVSGNIVSLAGRLMTIDTSQARIVQTDDRGKTRSTTSITPGESVSILCSSSNVSANAPVPAMLVVKIADVTLGGPVQSIGANSLTVLGRTFSVDTNTTFRVGNGLADLVEGEDVDISASRVNGTPVATAVCSHCYRGLPLPTTLIHGWVKSTGTSSWVIMDRLDKEWTIIVNAQTKITGDPKVGDTVDVLVNTDSAIAEAIMTSPRSGGFSPPFPASP